MPPTNPQPSQISNFRRRLLIIESPTINSIFPTIIERYTQLVDPADPDSDGENERVKGDQNGREEEREFKSGFDLQKFFEGYLAHCLASIAILVIYSFVVLQNASPGCEYLLYVVPSPISTNMNSALAEILGFSTSAVIAVLDQAVLFLYSKNHLFSTYPTCALVILARALVVSFGE